MTNSFIQKVFLAAAMAAASVVAGPTMASGQWGEEARNFQEHLDDYQAEVEMLIEEANAIARAHETGQPVDSRLEEYIEQWENVGVHGAIETRATVLYAGIWQGIIGLQQAAGNDTPPDEFRKLVDKLEAALWQGLGGVRLAAAQVRAGTAPQPAGSAHDDASPSEAIEAIVAQLREAVDAYEAGDTEQANELIAEAYIERFEGLEGDLIEQDAELVRSLEKDFNATLPMAMKRGAPASEVRGELDRMIGDLATAEKLLVESEKSRSEVF